jgi:hypothetical protein
MKQLSIFTSSTAEFVFCIIYGQNISCFISGFMLQRLPLVFSIYILKELFIGKKSVDKAM